MKQIMAKQKDITSIYAMEAPKVVAVEGLRTCARRRKRKGPSALT
jgi:hypothetical protein